MNSWKLIQVYREHQKGSRLSQSTIKRTWYFLTRFLGWLDGNDLRNVTLKELFDYLEYLRNYTSERKAPLSVKSIESELITLRGFFLFLYRNEYILLNPAEDLPVNLKGGKTHKAIFTVEEINRFLNTINIGSPNGLRDRALFEFMYSSALRASEILKMEPEHLDLEDRTCLLEEAKGKKDRYVPFSQTALQFLLLYLSKGRKKLLKHTSKNSKKYLFPGKTGPLSQKTLRARFREYLSVCGLENKGYTLHSIRHATATHLLEHGASIRYVQELLGHENLKTTQIYARPGEENIKAVYRTYHPRENEYWQETDENYLNDIHELKEQLLKSKAYEKERKNRNK